MDLILATIAIVLFQYKNPQRKFLHLVSVFVFLIFLPSALIHFINWSHILWLVAAIGLLTFYFLRFKEKESKDLIDYLKWIGIILLVISPISAYSFESGQLNNVLYSLSMLTIPVLATIYVYDRFILKPEKMKKKFIIILSIQTVLILLMFVYAFVQKLESDVQKENAMAAQFEATEIFKEAEKQRAIALENEKKAMELELALTKCNSEKK